MLSMWKAMPWLKQATTAFADILQAFYNPWRILQHQLPQRVLGDCPGRWPRVAPQIVEKCVPKTLKIHMMHVHA